MGVKGLWEILQDVRCLKEISDLKDETIAVDLATWICEAENVAMMKNVVEKPYLRNLFCRVLKLTKHGVKLIFVTDGLAPQLKWDTMAQRLNKRSDVSHSSQSFRGSRGRLNEKFSECCALLDRLGIVWVKSEGEAEATCAALNQQGFATACATTDGDAFLYGATKVYRNLTCQKGTTLECYEMKAVEEKLHLGRNSLISLGLMLGCDYSQDGIPGVGKVQALKLLHLWRQKGNPLDRMRNWKHRVESVNKQKPTHCGNCKHIGTKRDHSNSGCKVCSFQCKNGHGDTLDCTCEWHLAENERKEVALEDGVAKKARQVFGFPDESIISEFLSERHVVSPGNPCPPSLDGVVEFITSKLFWREETVIKKTLPMLTRWVLTHPNVDLGLSLVSINRTRKKEKVDVYEVEWSLPQHGNHTTCEEQALVGGRFPRAVQGFREKLEREKQEKKAKKKSKGQEFKPPKSDTKMTDFFKVKKVRNNSTRQIESHDDVTADAGVDSISAPLATIDLTDPPAQVEGTSSTDVSPTSDSSPKISKTPGIFVSIENLSTKETTTDKIADSNTSKAEENLLHTSNNVSFSLNFSLGNSLTRTPGKENEVPSCMNSSNQSLRQNITTSSPVFMSLADRIRLKACRDIKNS